VPLDRDFVVIGADAKFLISISLSRDKYWLGQSITRYHHSNGVDTTFDAGLGADLYVQDDRTAAI